MTPPHGIWAARAEVRISDDSPYEEVESGFPGPGPGYVNAFAPAESQERFQELFEAWLASENIELIHLEALQPLHDILDVDEDSMDAAIECARLGDLAAVFYVPEDPAAWDEDPDVDLLRASAGRPDLVWYRYVAGDDWELGFVISTSDEWVLIHAVDQARIVLDGHTFSRLDEIIDARVAEDSDFFARRSLALEGEAPVALAVALDNHRAIFAGVCERFPLVRLTLKNDDDDRVGLITHVGPNSVTIEGVSRAAEWVGIYEYLYDDIIAIHVGRAYEEALASVVGPAR